MRDLAKDVPVIITAARSDPPDEDTILRTLAEVWKDGATVGRDSADWDYNPHLPPPAEGTFPTIRDARWF